MRINIFCPHIWPDTAPTGEVMRQLVERWAGAGHECNMVSSLPWYRRHRVEEKWHGSLWHRQVTDWGSVLRLHPCAPASKANLTRRAAGFATFGAYAAVVGLSALPAADVTFAMSPPLTLAAAAAISAAARRTPLVLNLQDLHPDAAVTTGVVANPYAIAALRWLERRTYSAATAITVLSQATRTAVVERAPTATRVEVIANFANTETIAPGDRDNAYRRELGISPDTVLFLYAGNVGFSQPLGLVEAAARRLAGRRDICFVVNGDGAAMGEVRRWADGLENVIVRSYQPVERLSEVLAAADVHLVLLAPGLGDVSVPSKVYAAFGARRPVLVGADPGSEISRIVETAGAGLTIDPSDEGAFVSAVSQLADDKQSRSQMAANAFNAATRHTPDIAAAAYLRLFAELTGVSELTKATSPVLDN